jgi:outer membrane protein
MVDVQTKFIEYNKALQKRQADMMSPMIRKLSTVIRRAASRRGVDLVIDKAAVPFSRADLDLTDMVVQMYNSGGGGDDDEGSGEKKKD